MLFLASEGKINKTLKAIALGDKECIKDLLHLPLADVMMVVEHHRSNLFLGLAGEGARFVDSILRLKAK